MVEVDARIAQLEAMVAELRAEVERARQGRRESMRRTQRCPACGEQRILYVPKVREHAHSIPQPFQLGLHGGFWSGPQGGAQLEAYACEACGLVEWYLAEPLEVDGKNVKRLELPADRVAPSDPYR
jgi:hypothetical protein